MISIGAVIFLAFVLFLIRRHRREKREAFLGRFKQIQKTHYLSHAADVSIVQAAYVFFLEDAVPLLRRGTITKEDLGIGSVETFLKNLGDRLHVLEQGLEKSYRRYSFRYDGKGILRLTEFWK